MLSSLLVSAWKLRLSAWAKSTVGGCGGGASVVAVVVVVVEASAAVVSARRSPLPHAKARGCTTPRIPRDATAAAATVIARAARIATATWCNITLGMQMTAKRTYSGC
jgi:hypothetical protein